MQYRYESRLKKRHEKLLDKLARQTTKTVPKCEVDDKVRKFQTTLAKDCLLNWDKRNVHGVRCAVENPITYIPRSLKGGILKGIDFKKFNL